MGPERNDAVLAFSVTGPRSTSAAVLNVSGKVPPWPPWTSTGALTTWHPATNDPASDGGRGGRVALGGSFSGHLRKNLAAIA
jgi:hypothetical protein